MTANTNALGIGNGGYASWTYCEFVGTIDEVRIYNRALTTEEIADCYNYYPFETLNYAGRTLVRKLVVPEPSHGAWGSEEDGQTFDYVLKVANQVGGAWKIRLRAYDQTNIERLSNCTIYFYNGGEVSRQIYIYNGAYSQQFGNWYDLTSLSTVYIAMTVSATSTGTSYVYTYLEILVPNTSTYNLFIIVFEVT
jgi:hypothetical protein